MVASASLGTAACGDASTDGAGGGGGAEPGEDPFCATRPKLTFCEDFDTEPVPGAFSEQVEERATLTVDKELSASAPSSLRIVADGQPDSPAMGTLRHTFEAGERLRLFAQVYVPEAIGVGDVELGVFEIGSAYRVGFGASEDGSWWAFEEIDGAVQRFPGEGELPRDGWASVRWDVNLYDDGTGTGLLRFGNETIVEVDALTPPLGSTASPTMVVGLSRATGTWDIRFDNVTVEIEDE